MLVLLTVLVLCEVVSCVRAETIDHELMLHYHLYPQTILRTQTQRVVVLQMCVGARAAEMVADLQGGMFVHDVGMVGHGRFRSLYLFLEVVSNARTNVYTTALMLRDVLHMHKLLDCVCFRVSVLQTFNSCQRLRNLRYA